MQCSTAVQLINKSSSSASSSLSSSSSWTILYSLSIDIQPKHQFQFCILKKLFSIQSLLNHNNKQTSHCQTNEQVGLHGNKAKIIVVLYTTHKITFVNTSIQCLLKCDKRTYMTLYKLVRLKACSLELEILDIELNSSARTRTRLFDVTEQCDATHDPMIWVDGRSQHQRRNVGEVSASRFLVDRTLVDHRLAGTALFHVDGEDVDYGQWSVQDLGWLFHQTTVTTIPSSAVQKQPVNKHAYTSVQLALLQCTTHCSAFNSFYGTDCHLLWVTTAYLWTRFSIIRRCFWVLVPSRNWRTLYNPFIMIPLQ